jgi:hypothetical protein
MPFDTETGAAAGRKSSRKGSPNRGTAELRAFVVELIEKNQNAIANDLNALEPKDRVTFWLRLLEFALPKIAREHAEPTEPEKPDPLLGLMPPMRY